MASKLSVMCMIVGYKVYTPSFRHILDFDVKDHLKTCYVWGGFCMYCPPAEDSKVSSQNDTT